MVALSTAKGWMMAGKERLMETYQTSFFPFCGFDKNLSDAGSYWRVLFALISKAWSVPKIISLWPVIHGQVILSDVFACERRSWESQVEPASSFSRLTAAAVRSVCGRSVAFQN